MVTKLLCGCRHDERQWLEECDEHRDEHYEMHVRAEIDRHRDVTRPRIPQPGNEDLR